MQRMIVLLWVSLVLCITLVAAIVPLTKQSSPQLMVPNIVHIIILDKKPLARYTYLSILTIFHQIDPWTLYIHCIHSPHGEYWSMLMESSYAPRIKERKVLEPISIFGKPPPSKLAHKSDIVRMEILQKLGGIYIDTDIIVLRSFDALRNASLTMAMQTNKNLCNGLILAHRDSTFLKAWMEGFRQANFETCWDCHSVVYPSKLMKNMTNKADLQILPIESFYDPSFSRGDIHELFKTNGKKPPRMRPPYIGMQSYPLSFPIPCNPPLILL